MKIRLGTIALATAILAGCAASTPELQCLTAGANWLSRKCYCYQQLAGWYENGFMDCRVPRQNVFLLRR